jgi:hypothetical protein
MLEHQAILGNTHCMPYLSICNKFDSNSRIQLHALWLKIQNLALLLSTHALTAMSRHPHVRRCVAAETSTPVRDFHRFRPLSSQHGRVVPRLDHCVPDSVSPVLARQARFRGIGETPFDAANIDMLHGRQSRCQRPETLEVADLDLEVGAGGVLAV